MKDEYPERKVDAVVVGDTHPMYDEVVDRFGAQAAIRYVEVVPHLPQPEPDNMPANERE